MASSTEPPFPSGSIQANSAENIAEALHDLIAIGEPGDASKALEWAVNCWYDYHQSEANKWLKLMSEMKNLH